MSNETTKPNPPKELVDAMETAIINLRKWGADNKMTLKQIGIIEGNGKATVYDARAEIVNESLLDFAITEAFEAGHTAALRAGKSMIADLMEAIGRTTVTMRVSKGSDSADNLTFAANEKDDRIITITRKIVP